MQRVRGCGDWEDVINPVRRLMIFARGTVLARQIRLAVIAIGCMIAGPVLIYRHFAELPRLEGLSKVTGEVRVEMETRRTRRSTYHYPVLMLNESPKKYKYLDWFPKADEIPMLLRQGEAISIWTDAGGNNWVWQIERDGRVLVSYDEVRDAVASNGRFNLVLGLGVLALGIGAAVLAYRKFTAQT